MLLGACTPGPRPAPPVASTDTVAGYFSPPQRYPGPTWTRDGRPVDGRELDSIAGPEHCGWQRAVLLQLGWPLGTVVATPAHLHQFVPDPDGVPGRGLRS